MTTLHLPPMPADADPVILPGLLSGLGITRRPAPTWVTNPDVIESIALGFYEIDVDIVTRDKPTLRQIEKRIAAACCFYLTVQHAYVAQLERRVNVNRSSS